MTETTLTSWDQTVLNHVGWIRSIVFSRLGDVQHVEDVLNDVVVDALKSRHQANEIQRPQPWLYRLTLRKVLQFRRSQGRYRKFQTRMGQQADETCQLPLAPLESMLGHERRLLVRQALHGLPGKEAEILILKYVHQWTYREISDNLGIDFQKVLYRLRTARHRFRARLYQLGIESDSK